jgi:hypothetical protein
MLRESPSLSWIATIVLVTAVVTEETMAALMRLQEAGRRIVLISLADDPPPDDLGHILAYHIPANVFPDVASEKNVEGPRSYNGSGIRLGQPDE